MGRLVTRRIFWWVVNRVLTHIKNVSFGLLISANINRTVFNINPPLSPHSYCFRCFRAVVMKLVMSLERELFLSAAICWFFWNPVSQGASGLWRVHAAWYLHQWYVLPLDYFVIPSPSVGLFFFHSHLYLPLELLSLFFVCLYYVCSRSCWYWDCYCFPLSCQLLGPNWGLRPQVCWVRRGLPQFWYPRWCWLSRYWHHVIFLLVEHERH